MNIIDKIKNRFTRQALASPVRWVAAAAFTFAHIFALASLILLGPGFLSMDIMSWVFPLAVVLPGIITMTLLPGGWKRWYRWAALLGLAMMLFENSNPYIVILFGETWILHRSWVTERTIGLKHLFNSKQRKAAVTGVCFKPGTEPKKKTKTLRTPKTA
ncbi:hypothetical protein GCM10023063_16980 [Arthrobacter methylotrophus]|uniref:Uncharacterized protein n=1 Tax=Arthrobacter methylotrophus TaxID=121291 RepID=A0ABV5UPC8_9MICC